MINCFAMCGGSRDLKQTKEGEKGVKTQKNNTKKILENNRECFQSTHELDSAARQLQERRGRFLGQISALDAGLHQWPPG